MFDISTGKFASEFLQRFVGDIEWGKRNSILYDKYAIDLDLSGTDKKKKKDLKYIEQGYDIVAIIETEEEVQNAITKPEGNGLCSLSWKQAMYKQQLNTCKNFKINKSRY